MSVLVFAPAVFCSELPRNFAGTELGEKVGQRLSEPGALARHLGADRHKEHHDQDDQQNVDHGDGPAAPAQERSRRLTSGLIR